jgi:sulfite reductase (NADPH) flavoprotein alpha-component
MPGADGSWVRWAAIVAGVPLALYLLSPAPAQQRGPRGPRGTRPTDGGPFEGFLLDEPEPVVPARPARGTRPVNGGPFEGFLLEEPAAPARPVRGTRPTDGGPFEGFLLDAGAAGAPRKAPAPAKPAAVKPAARHPTPDMARVVVAFGTEYGFSKEIAEKLGAKLWDAGKYW